ncbi:MAG: adenylate/guanylate cyclase domain-containing protein [Pseudonocardia sp.]
MSDDRSRSGGTALDGDDREPHWLARLTRLLDLGRLDAGDGASDTRVEELILGGPRRYTRAELLEQTGMDPDLAARLWRSMGFAEVDDHDVVFTDGDRDALRQLETLRAVGMVPTDIQEAVTRTVGQAMASLADWQVEMLYQLLDAGSDAVEESDVLDVGARVLPMLQKMQNYVWRRHLAAAAGRLLTALPEEPDTRTLVVGFADLVGFTRTTRRLTPTELTDLIDQFQALATEVVAGQHGRVVKTVGDEVLFVTEEAVHGAEIALGLVDKLAAIDALPELRIGLAVGPVVTRFGDVYGEVVNIAARLTTHARPGRILVDRNLAAALDAHPGYRIRPRRPLSVRGYRHLQSWGLTRAT